MTGTKRESHHLAPHFLESSEETITEPDIESNIGLDIPTFPVAEIKIDTTDIDYWRNFVSAKGCIDNDPNCIMTNNCFKAMSCLETTNMNSLELSIIEDSDDEEEYQTALPSRWDVSLLSNNTDDDEVDALLSWCEKSIIRDRIIDSWTDEENLKKKHKSY
jgi:hypothetical protein